MSNRVCPRKTAIVNVGTGRDNAVCDTSSPSPKFGYHIYCCISVEESAVFTDSQSGESDKENVDPNPDGSGSQSHVDSEGECQVYKAEADYVN
jgi:hypothetical protein